MGKVAISAALLALIADRLDLITLNIIVRELLETLAETYNSNSLSSTYLYMSLLICLASSSTFLIWPSRRHLRCFGTQIIRIATGEFERFCRDTITIVPFKGARCQSLTYLPTVRLPNQTNQGDTRTKSLFYKVQITTTGGMTFKYYPLAWRRFSVERSFSIVRCTTAHRSLEECNNSHFNHPNAMEFTSQSSTRVLRTSSKCMTLKSTAGALW
jgi:hypothetical protein